MFACQGRALIYQAQSELAMGNPAKGIPPNARMLIWMGKQYLGQRERFDIIQTPLSGSEPQIGEVPAGFEIMVPGGGTQTVINGPKNEPKDRDELPIVEALIVQELNPGTVVERTPGLPRVVSGHTSEI